MNCKYALKVIILLFMFDDLSLEINFTKNFAMTWLINVWYDI